MRELRAEVNRLQRKVDAMKQRLQDKGAELAAAEAELAKECSVMGRLRGNM